MRNIISYFIVTAIAISGIAQRFTPLQQPIPPGANLMQVGHNIVLIHPLDGKKFSQKWVCFDSALNILSAKKIVSPDWQNIVSQAYIPAHDAIVRVDQLVFNDSLYLSLVRFDAAGMPTHKIEIARSGKHKIHPFPFYISQSSDRKYIALVQPVAHSNDKLAYASFVLDDMLNMVSITKGEQFYDPIVFDLLPPLVDSDGTLYLPMVDKFTSYRLGTSLQLSALTKAGSNPITIPIDRKKLKDLKLQLKDGSLKMTALYSNSDNKTEVAGSLFATVNLNDPKQANFSFNGFDASTRRTLSKKVVANGRKGSLLNYLYLLPTKELKKGEQYAVLLGEAMPNRKYETPKVADLSEDLDRIKQRAATINSLSGSYRRRGPSPVANMNYAEASVYVATMEKTVGDGGNPTPSLASNPPGPGSNNYEQQLLYLNQNDSSTSIQIHKVRPANDLLFDFFTYAEVNGRYQAIYYQLPSLKSAQLVTTMPGTDGKPVKKILFEERSRIVQPGFPTLIFLGKKLIAVYEDRYTLQMGLVAVTLPSY